MFTWDVIIIYNYFIGKLREIYFTKGSQDQFAESVDK